MRRLLPFVLAGLIISPAALAQMPAPAACALHQPEKPRSRGFGTIIGFETVTDAQAEIPRREARQGGAIDPRYIGDPRAMVRQDNGVVDVFDVPAGLTVHVGERVKLQGSYRSNASTCSYIPILIVPNDVPAA